MSELSEAHAKLDHLVASLDAAKAELIRLLDCVSPADAESINAVLAFLSDQPPTETTTNNRPNARK